MAKKMNAKPVKKKVETKTRRFQKIRELEPKVKRRLLIVISVIVVITLVGFFAIQSLLQFQPGEGNAKIRLIDYATGEDVSDHEITAWYPKSNVDFDEDIDKMFDLSNFKEQESVKAEEFNDDISAYKILWIEVGDSKYAKHFYLIGGVNGNYTFYVFPISSTARFNILNETYSVFDGSNGSYTIFGDVPSKKCFYPLYDPDIDTYKDWSLGVNPLAKITKTLAFKFSFNDTIGLSGSGTHVKIEYDDDRLTTLTINNIIYLILLDGFNGDYQLNFKFSIESNISVSGISSGLLTIPNIDATGLSYSQLNTIG